MWALSSEKSGARCSCRGFLVVSVKEWVITSFESWSLTCGLLNHTEVYPDCVCQIGRHVAVVASYGGAVPEAELESWAGNATLRSEYQKPSLRHIRNGENSGLGGWAPHCVQGLLPHWVWTGSGPIGLGGVAPPH